MKKILATLLAMVMCFGVLAFSACEIHEHAYSTWSVKTPAKCETAGSREKKCSCGDVIVEQIPATGHNYVGGVCTDCGATN